MNPNSRLPSANLVLQISDGNNAMQQYVSHAAIDAFPTSFHKVGLIIKVFDFPGSGAPFSDEFVKMMLL